LDPFGDFPMRKSGHKGLMANLLTLNWIIWCL